VSSPDVLSAGGGAVGGPSVAESLIPRWGEGRPGGSTRPSLDASPTSLDIGGNNSTAEVCEGGPVIVNRESRRYWAVPCGRWACRVCGPRKRRRFMRRVLVGLEGTDAPAAGVGRVRPPRFLTLTSRPEDSRSWALDHLTERFEALRRLVARRGGRMEYVGVPELTRAGMPHLHIVFRGPWLAQREWSALAVEAGFGSIVDVRRVRSGDVARYAAKGLGGYLSKSVEAAVWPRHFRRVRFSRGWAPGWIVRPRPERGAWELASASDPGFVSWWVERFCTPRGGQGPPRPP
jgi:hypothetical protein